jgi:hypothetical protein
MTNEHAMSLAEMDDYTKAQAASLTAVVNVLAARLGAEEAAHMLIAGAIALVDKHMTRADGIAWLRGAADNLAAAPQERAN